MVIWIRLKVRYSGHRLNYGLFLGIWIMESSPFFRSWLEYWTKSSLFRCPAIVRYSSHGLNIKPLKDCADFNHSNTWIVCYSDPHCMCTFVICSFESYTTIWLLVSSGDKKINNFNFSAEIRIQSARLYKNLHTNLHSYKNKCKKTCNFRKLLTNAIQL